MFYRREKGEKQSSESDTLFQQLLRKGSRNVIPKRVQKGSPIARKSLQRTNKNGSCSRQFKALLSNFKKITGWKSHYFRYGERLLNRFTGKVPSNQEKVKCNVGSNIATSSEARDQQNVG